MTVSSTTVKNSYSGNSSTTAFAYSFKIFADTDLQVIIRSSTGTETTKSLTTHYTVSGAGDASGGNVTFTSGNTPATGETVVIRRAVPQTQAIDYIANDPFPAETHEEGLDRATMTIQQMQEALDRSFKVCVFINKSSGIHRNRSGTGPRVPGRSTCIDHTRNELRSPYGGRVMII